MTTSLTVTRIAHACQLIQIGDLRILTDPWFTETATYHQGEPIASDVASLGQVDALVISHDHYDHCDLDSLVAGGVDLTTPMFGPGTVTTLAASKGFTHLHTIEAWESATLGELTVTATPAQHAVHEVTFIIQAGGRTVFFGGDSLRIPELDQIPERLGRIDLAILPVNGLCVRPANMRQVVMDAEQAAALTAVLNPTIALPHHYAFHSGRLGDQMITKGDQDPRHYTDALARVAPQIATRIGPARNTGDSPLNPPKADTEFMPTAADNLAGGRADDGRSGSGRCSISPRVAVRQPSGSTVPRR